MNRSSQKIKRVLENLFLEYQTSDYLRSDPVEFPHLFSDLRDREISGFISALFSYGNITAIKDHLKRIFAICGNSPYRFLLNEDLKAIRKNLKSYRFQKPEDTYLFCKQFKINLGLPKAMDLNLFFFA